MSLSKILLAFAIAAGLGIAVYANSAVYFCSETGAYGAAWGNDDDASVAKDYCQQNGGTQCKQLLFCNQPGFGAIAVSSNAVIGASCGAKTQAEADAKALNSCRKYQGENCNVKHRWQG